jgi:hypothetical protein
MTQHFDRDLARSVKTFVQQKYSDAAWITEMNTLYCLCL